MEIIPVEIVTYIINCFQLDVVSQLSFLMICKHCYRALSFLVIKDCTKITRHSSYLKHYHFLRTVDIISKVIVLPQNVQTVIFSSAESDILLERLPPSVKHLTLFKKFNKPLPKLPASLIKLKLGSSFDQPLPKLPAQLKSLTMGKRFNQPVDHLPSSLIKLKLGLSFNQPINHLPPNLQTLQLDFDFNQPILSLPTGLKYLQLSWEFNQSIDHCLPEGLEWLYLGPYFNQPINVLPDSLTYLHLNCSQYKHTLDNCLPPRLKILKLASLNKLPNINTLSFDVRIHVWKQQTLDSLVIAGNLNGATIYRRKRADE